MSNEPTRQKGDILLEMKDIVIDGYSDDRWHEIVKGVDITLRRGEIMGLIGPNGSGKTTSIAKIANMLGKDGLSPILAAGDTFRAASIEQLEHHANKLGVDIIKHQYGADPAAVVFDAVKFAKSKHKDVVLVDTAGRMHTDKNLMDELSKIVRVNNPDLKILVIDSLTGNDVVIQAENYDKTVGGIDGMILTKTEINEKGGSLLSAAYSTEKPILFFLPTPSLVSDYHL